jgi:hypothetical protein
MSTCPAHAAELASRQAWPTSGDSRSVVVCSVFTPSTAYLLLWVKLEFFNADRWNTLQLMVCVCPRSVTQLQCMTVVGDTVALLLTREGGGSEQVITL